MKKGYIEECCDIAGATEVIWLGDMCNEGEGWFYVKI